MRHTLPLQYLDAVARAGSIRSAAQDLSITPSALNRRILAMEHELGVELFERHTNGVYLNSAGELFIQHVRNQMADLERVKSRIADLSGLRLGKVKIAATHEASRYFLPNEIAIYRKEFPGVSFQVNGMSRSVVADQLATYEADLIVVFQPDKLADVHTLIQAKQDMMCVVSTDHPLAKKKNLSLVDCIEHKILLPPKGEGIRDLIEHACVRKGLPCDPSVESNDPAFLERIAIEGGGVSFSLPISIAETEANKRLKVLPLKKGEVETGFLFVGHLHNRSLPVAAAKFIETLRKKLLV